MAGASRTPGSTSSLHRLREPSKWAARRETEVNENETTSGSVRNSGAIAGQPVCRWVGSGTKTGRYFANVQSRQPGQHVDPRGGDDRFGAADDGGVQQSRDVRPAREAEQPPIAPAFWNAALPTVRDCVTDFETAKSRRGVQACPQPDRTQDDSKLLQTIQ